MEKIVLFVVQGKGRRILSVNMINKKEFDHC